MTNLIGKLREISDEYASLAARFLIPTCGSERLVRDEARAKVNALKSAISILISGGNATSDLIEKLTEIRNDLACSRNAWLTSNFDLRDIAQAKVDTLNLALSLINGAQRVRAA